MTTMVEKIARALWAAERDDMPPEMRMALYGDHFRVEWEQVAEPMQAKYRSMAQAVLDALIEPTEAMLMAGADEVYGQKRPFAGDILLDKLWQSMIQAAKES